MNKDKIAIVFFSILKTKNDSGLGFEILERESSFSLDF